jgi:hypothetical protein
MDGLSPLAVFDELEFHFQFALAFSFDVFDRNLHGTNGLQRERCGNGSLITF